MMTFDIKYQESYSRGGLLLRTFFGFFYIIIPHGILLYVLMIGLMFAKIATFFIILFTGKWNKEMFAFNVKMVRYQLRVQARLLNLADGYPAFGLNGTDTQTSFDVKYQEEVNRGSMLIRAFFGIFYVSIPHGIVLTIRMIGVYIFSIIGFFSILFTGKYQQGMFDFVVKTFRWASRVNAYLAYLVHDYPAFSGEVQPGENEEGEAGMESDEILDA